MLYCGHDEKNWISICSAHGGALRIGCGLCNTGRCIVCMPEIPVGSKMKFTRRDTGAEASPFPNLGVRAK